MPPPMVALGRSLTAKFTSTMSGEPATGSVVMSTLSMNGSRCRRCLERSSATFDSQEPSSWRSSRRSVSSLLRVVPVKLMWRTYDAAARIDEQRQVDDLLASSSVVGTGSTLAK